jgi:hypothetical protein
MQSTTRIFLLGAMLALVPCGIATAQGIEVKSDALVLVGSAGNTTKPASIQLDKVRKATPEAKTIRSEGVAKGSARYELLMSEMNQRIKAAAERAAQSGGHDCVVSSKDITDDKGMRVVDLTDKVIEQLES